MHDFRPFIFTVIKLYSNQGGFETVVHTIVIGSTGLFAGGGRGETAAKEAESGHMLKMAVSFVRQL